MKSQGKNFIHPMIIFKLIFSEFFFLSFLHRALIFLSKYFVGMHGFWTAKCQTGIRTKFNDYFEIKIRKFSFTRSTWSEKRTNLAIYCIVSEEIHENISSQKWINEISKVNWLQNLTVLTVSHCNKIQLQCWKAFHAKFRSNFHWILASYF